MIVAVQKQDSADEEQKKMSTSILITACSFCFTVIFLFLVKVLYEAFSVWFRKGYKEARTEARKLKNFDIMSRCEIVGHIFTSLKN